MNYEEFKDNLQQEIQANFSQQINFIEGVAAAANEVLESLSMRFDGQSMAPAVYPEKLYADYQNGASIAEIADSVSAFISMDPSGCPKMPEITPENAAKCISFSLVNKEKNKHLLEKCPYKDVHDMAAVPRWHISDEASFLVTGKVQQMLKMTKEEILEIAQRNTESAEYTCRGLDDAMREVMADEGMDEELMAELFPMPEPPFYVITSQNCMDGSCAVLSDSFMQEITGQIGSEELYLLPASRHEMIAVNPNAVSSTPELKDLVMSVNSSPEVLKPEDYLSDSVYKYNAATHSLSVCDSRGLFHDKPSTSRDSIKPQGRGRGL